MSPAELKHLRCERFSSSSEVLSVRAADTVVLMDRSRGAYHTLNEVGGRVWELAATGSTVAEVVERLLGEYDVSREQLERDVFATLRQLVQDRLLVPGIAPEPSPPKSRPTLRPVPGTAVLDVPSVFRCGLLITWFKVLLRARGFLGTIEWIRGRIEPLPATSEARLEAVKSVEYAVAMAGALYPGRAKCLEQSLTLYYLLRRSCVAAVYCQGVQPYPFQAHAWIEYQGEVINDVAEHARFFARLPEQLP